MLLTCVLMSDSAALTAVRSGGVEPVVGIAETAVARAATAVVRASIFLFAASTLSAIFMSNLLSEMMLIVRLSIYAPVCRGEPGALIPREGNGLNPCVDMLIVA